MFLGHLGENQLMIFDFSRKTILPVLKYSLPGFLPITVFPDGQSTASFQLSLYDQSNFVVMLPHESRLVWLAMTVSFFFLIEG